MNLENLFSARTLEKYEVVEAYGLKDGWEVAIPEIAEGSVFPSRTLLLVRDRLTGKDEDPEASRDISLEQIWGFYHRDLQSGERQDAQMRIGIVVKDDRTGLEEDILYVLRPRGQGYTQKTDMLTMLSGYIQSRFSSVPDSVSRTSAPT